MGRAVQTVTFQCWPGQEIATAERLMPGFHALPGTGKGAGSKARVIGITRLKES